MMGVAAMVRDLQRIAPNGIREEEFLSAHTTLAIGGPADVMVCPTNLREAVATMQYVGARSVSCHVLGCGSNLLVHDDGVRGVVLKTPPALNLLRLGGGEDVRLMVQAGTSLREVLRFCLTHGLQGIERLAGIPASVGGAVAMNAGVYDCTIGGHVRRVLAFDRGALSPRYIFADECGFGYRSSVFLAPDAPVILAAELGLSRGCREEIARIMRERLEVREARHPWRDRSAGSVFRNPDGYSAGSLIEQAGLKGVRRGDALISPMHANFIVNAGTASADDVRRLIDEVRTAVWQSFGIELVPEVRLWGFDETDA